MAGRKDNVDTLDPELAALSPLQRMLRGAGIPMPLDMVREELALFTPEERRELARGNAEQCEANR